jgi:hypothetical protein
MRDARSAIVQAALWLVAHRAHCTYSEGSQRMSGINRPFVLPFVGDCSATVTDWYNWAGVLEDPNHVPWSSGQGYTGTLLSAGEHLALWRRNGVRSRIEEVKPADILVLGPGTGVHAVLVVGLGNGDPVVASMGQPGDPGIYRASQMAFLGEATYLRFDTMAKKVHYPPGYKKIR